MSDAILITTLSRIPVATVITDRFLQQARLIAGAKGMPDLPCIEVPYPVAGTGAQVVARFARQAAPAVLSALFPATAQ